MYTDGFDELSEAENRPPRTYVSTGGQDLGKLQRENERLRKSLEKEQFFNRLLDQELKDIKSAQADGGGYDPGQVMRRNGISRGIFNTLLIITIALAGFVAYTLYYNKQYNLFPAAVATFETPSSETPAPVVADSVPNIIFHKKAAAPSPVQQQSAIVPDKKQPAAEVKAKPKAVRTEQPETVAATEEAVKEPEPAPAPIQAPAERTVIAKYMVSSKANFYNEPDENTLRSYFISPAKDKIVNALDDKNGFIYVEFKNDIGYVTKGWLSKADLTKQ